MYRFMFCTTKNPLGETAAFDYSSLHDVIACCISFRNKDCEKVTAGYSVYELDEDGNLRETLLNWQHDHKNTFGRLVDPQNPHYFFAA